MRRSYVGTPAIVAFTEPKDSSGLELPNAEYTPIVSATTTPEISTKPAPHATKAPAKVQTDIKKQKASTSDPRANNELLEKAGIDKSEWEDANWIIMREGSYNPCIINGGAIDCSYAVNGGRKSYGVCQALPGSKMASAGDDWATNPITQLKWCDSYAKSRYGGWAQAKKAWQRQKWW